MIEGFARAKINLALHVTGRRDDGYHLLDSIVVFADVGDQLSLTVAQRDTLEVTGPFAGQVPVGQSNLVWRGADLLADRPQLKIALEKNLPPSSGIGGGTADAAAVLRGLCEQSQQPLPDVAALTRLGADMPICCYSKPCRMRGIGEDVQPIQHMPMFHAVLVNPGVEVSTPKIFASLANLNGQGLLCLPQSSKRDDWLGYLSRTRNDLAPAAKKICPEIVEVEAALQASNGCQFARMSGSGATVFGLFNNADSADRAAKDIAKSQKDWWVQKTKLLGSDDA